MSMATEWNVGSIAQLLLDAADARAQSRGSAGGSIVISGANPTMRDVVTGVVHHHHEADVER